MGDNKKLTVLSLFDGIGGGMLALNRAGVEIDKYYASEVDKYAIQVAKGNFPEIIEVGDIAKLSYNKKTEELITENGKIKIGKIDLLIGGSPCQGFTFAGKRQGATTKAKVEKTKDGETRVKEVKVEVLTLKDYLKLKKEGFIFNGQSYLFWEYVRLLKEIKPDYFLLENVKMEKKWKDVITKTLKVKPTLINSNLVSAQNRQRLYWTNINSGKIELPEDKEVVLKDIIIPEMDTKYPLSKVHFDAFMKSYPSWSSCDIDGKAKPLLATYYKQPPHCPYIKSNASTSGYRRLSPLECERLQTLPDNYTLGLSDTQRYKTIGNGWTIDVVSHIFKYLNKKEED